MFKRSFLTRTILAALFVTTIIGSASVLAQTAATETYFSESSLNPGVIVSLVEGRSEVVETATRENQDRLFGVVVKQADSTLRLESDERTTFVTTFGGARTLVTDVNGGIRAGDKLAISPISGVAMRSTKDEAIIGTALEDFNQDSVSLGSKAVVTSTGEEKTAQIGIIKVQVQPEGGNNTIVPSFLSSFGESIAGKPVNSFRLFTALAVMVITLATSSVILFGAIRSAMIAIGRNPLSKKLVYRGLFQVVIVVLIVFLGGVAGSYVILRV